MHLPIWLRSLVARPNRTPARRAPLQPACRPRLEVLEDRTAPAVFTVVNTLDDGNAGSLRWAINQANNDADALSNINFNIPGTGAHTIALNAGLPTINHPVIIDGFSQPGASQNSNSVPFNGRTDDNAVRLITLDGSAAGQSSDGLTIAGGNSTVQGLVVQKFATGIHLITNGNDTIVGNEVRSTGNDDGDSDDGSVDGINVDNVANNIIGGTAPASRNLLVSLAPSDVDYTIEANIKIGGAGAHDNRVEGNYIGVDATGESVLGQQFAAVYFIGTGANNTIGGTTPEARNVIAGSWNVNVEIDYSADYAAVVEGNYIGTNAEGSAVPSGVETATPSNGIAITATGHVTIGGTAPGSGNVISGGGTGVYTFFNGDLGAGGALIQGNYIGTDASGTNPLPNEGTGVQVGEDNDQVVGNIIAFNAGAGVVVAAQADRIEGNSIYANGGLGIDVHGDGIINTNAVNDAANHVGKNNDFPGSLIEEDFPLINFPLLTSVVSSGADTSIQGTYNSGTAFGATYLPNTTFTLDFYANAAPAPSGYGQGQTYLAREPFLRTPMETRASSPLWRSAISRASGSVPQRPTRAATLRNSRSTSRRRTRRARPSPRACRPLSRRVRPGRTR